MRESIVHPLKPIYDEESSVLILGSFPSVISRKEMFYYANPANRFWKVLACVYNEEIDDRTAFCHHHHIALWDVIHSCSIINSSDSSIEDVIPNDIDSLLNKTKIHTIFTTGRKADQLYKRYIHVPLEHIALASTSGANARMSLQDLVREYQVIQEKTDEEN